MDIFWITQTQFIPFLLIFIRVNGIIFAAPLFGEKVIPTQLKIGLSLLIALILVPIIRMEPFTSTPEPFILLYMASTELMVGLILGFAARLLFAGVQLAGQLAGYQMGIAMANVLDPISGSQISLIGQLEALMALLIFLSVDAHHLFIRAIVNSFQLIPPLEFQPQGILVERIMALAGKMFVLAIQIGAPVIAVVLFTNVFFALMARTMPEMNIFIVAMPLGIAIGLFVLGTSMPFFAHILTRAFHNLNYDLISLMKGM